MQQKNIRKNLPNHLYNFDDKIHLPRVLLLLDKGNFVAPNNYCAFDADDVIDLILASFSITTHEKIGFLLRLPDFSEQEILQLNEIFKKEQKECKDSKQNQEQFKKRVVSEIKQLLLTIKKNNSLDLLRSININEI